MKKRIISFALFVCVFLTTLCVVSCGTDNGEIEKLYDAYRGGRSEAQLKYVAPSKPDAKLSELDDDQLWDLLIEMGVEVNKNDMPLVKSYIEHYEDDPDYCKDIAVSYALDLYTANRLRKAVKLYYGTMTADEANKVSLCLLSKKDLLAELSSLGVDLPKEITAKASFYTAIRAMVLYYEMIPGVPTAGWIAGDTADYKQVASEIASEYGDEIFNAVRVYNGMTPLETTE